MALGKPVAKSAPLRVLYIFAALVIAAFLGAVLGLVWQSSSLSDDEAEVPAPTTVETPVA